MAKTGKKKVQRQQARRSPIRRLRRSSAADLLIIECDSSTLRSQGLAVGTGVVGPLNLFFPNRQSELLQTSSADQLTADFGSVKETHSHFNTVLVIGHSNEQGLQPADSTQNSFP